MAPVAPKLRTEDSRLKMSAPVGIRTRVAGSKGQHDWPCYTTGAKTVFSTGVFQSLKKVSGILEEFHIKRRRSLEMSQNYPAGLFLQFRDSLPLSGNCGSVTFSTWFTRPAVDSKPVVSNLSLDPHQFIMCSWT